MAVLTLEKAAQALLDGRLLVFPTETFYALGCDACNPQAVSTVFAVKQRQHSLPLPVVVSSHDMVLDLAEAVSDEELVLMKAFWPGPLSIILPAKPGLPELLSCGTGTVAVRHSPHPAVNAVCEVFGGPVVASSANISGYPPAAREEDIDQRIFCGSAGFYTQGDPPAGGLPSTVVQAGKSYGRISIRILRPGAVSENDLRNAGFTVFDE